MTIELPPVTSLPTTESEFRTFFEQCALGMARSRFADARWLDANEAFCQMLGRSRAEMLSTPWPEMTHPEDINPDLDLFNRMAVGEVDSYSVEKRLIHKQGHYIWARLTLSLIRDSDGRPDYEIAVIENISERKAAEDTLVDSRLKLEAERAWLQATVDTIPTGLIMLDEGGELILENAEWKRTWANNSELNAVIDYDTYKGFRPDTGERIAGEEWPCAMSLKQGVRTRDVILDIERFNGTRGTIVVSSAPILDKTGRIVGAVAANMDISELRAAQTQLEEASRRKDEFLAMLSHELRGPLSAIVNTLQLLDRRTAEPGSRRYLDILRRQGHMLQGLVDDLLDVSRITRGLIDMKTERQDVASIVDKALESVQSLMDEKHHEVSVTLPRRAVEVVGDAVRIEQVLVNLLTNAAKYTDESGHIAISLERIGSDARISVSDNGIGISDEVRSRIFDLFGQAERGLARSQGGLGIGLTIAKNLVEQHGGKIEAASAGLGKGAEFVITLPLADVEAQTLVTVPIDSSEPEPEPEQLQPLQIHAGLGKRVLVVDDSVDIAQTLALILEDFGHNVAIAYDGPSALTKAEEHDPEVILLDIGLPGMDGYEVARRLRANPRMRAKTIAAITGYGQESDKQLAMDAGFNRHFTKPVDIKTLETFVNGAGF